MNLPDKNKLLFNFSRCSNWEEKYLYIIELGRLLPPFPATMRTLDYLIPGCQSQVWITISIDEKSVIKLDGDSNAAIVKGLIATVFILYQGLTLAEIISFDAGPFFSKLALTQHLTLSRSHGLEAIVWAIRSQANALL